MEREMKLELRMPNNKYKTFKEDYVPYYKSHEYAKLEEKLAEDAKKDGREPSKVEYEELQADFVAGLFESEEVTKELILKGLDTLDRDKVSDIIRYRVMGFKKEDEEALKKAMTEEILDGVNSVNSK